MPNNITRQYQRPIKNPVDLLRWSSFTKIVNSCRVINQFCRKCTILEVLQGSQYRLSVEMLLDLINRISSERKVKKNLGIQAWVISGSSRGYPENVVGTSQITHAGTSLERQIKASPGRHFRTSLGRSNRIFRGRPGDVGGGRPLGVLETKVCWLGC